MMIVKLAFNPLPWYLYADGWRPERAPSLPDMLKMIKRSGYDAVHAEIPNTHTPASYRALLAELGLAPAPGYFQADFGNADTISATIDSASRIARDHAALGLDRIFLAEQFGIAGPRLATPAQGVAADPVRLARIAEGIGKAAAAMTREGVVPCLHPHVGTWIETAAEANFVLDAVAASDLLVGPDTGHLAWTGADPARFIAQHRDRIGAIHIKDVRKSVAAAGQAAGWDYRGFGAHDIWTEPGHGDLDLDGALRVLSDFDGWFIVEVDIAAKPEESALKSAQWLRPRLEARR